MSFSLFFTITGVVFTILSSIIIKNIYDMYPITKVTEFLKPTEETIFNRISTSVFPIIIWGIIETPVLGYNNFFILGLLLNIIINCAITYVIVYGHDLFSHDEGKIMPIFSIIIATLIGFLINYLTLFIGRYGDLTNSILGMILIIILFVLIRVLKPNVFIFKNQKK